MRLDEFSFDEPIWLWAAAAIPLFAIVAALTLRGLSPLRRTAIVLVRSLLLLLIVLALAEIQWVQRTDKVTVLYLLDQSESIPRDKRQYMLDYVVREVARHRNETESDRAGVIVFGGQARIEIPPIDMELPTLSRTESVGDLKRDATSLEAALQLAKASFPEDSARRIVVVTDGNENLGDASAAARLLAEDGIGIDVVPIRLPRRSEVAIDKVVIPVDLREGQAFEAKVVIENLAAVDPDAAEPPPTTGTLRLIERDGAESRLIAERPVELRPGTNVFGFRHRIDRTAMLTYEATFVPDDPESDFRLQNNQGAAYAHVRGKGRILWIEDAEHRGEFDELVGLLRRQSFEVDLMASDELFTTPIELLEYDCVVLANLPRSGGEADGTRGGAEIYAFTDAQVEMLVRNTQEFGCGLVMIGGDRSFGVGGWANTRLEEAMPVDFQVKNDRIEAVGALALVMHASEMPEGNYWQKVIGVEAIRALGPMDYCGVVVWEDLGGRTRWLWGEGNGGFERVGPLRRLMLGAVQRMSPGDMPDFDASMQLALDGLGPLRASVKHMIIISDGDPAPPSPALLDGFVDANIEISTVAVGTHGPPTATPLQAIADATGGKFYNVTDPQALPRIFQREARKVAKPLIFENPAGISVLPRPSAYAHPALQGLSLESLPPIRGYVSTTIKQNPLVEQLLIAAAPDDGGQNSSLFATWRFGLGRCTVLTTDAGRRWATDWRAMAGYDRFFAQVIRHAMRPVDESADFTIASRTEEGRVALVVNALDENDAFVNGLPMIARALSPSLEPIEIELRQTAPGRYEGDFPAEDPGSYLFTILPGEGYDRLSGGVTVPVSGEFSDQETNWPLLETLASSTPRGGR
ncbi:MAG TPA: VWA domain-containing protein, partial [Pirellulaceae bacterium]|nr:VWA domain-containing protein [Pirellulaceae bacterium]